MKRYFLLLLIIVFTTGCQVKNESSKESASIVSAQKNEKDKQVEKKEVKKEDERFPIVQIESAAIKQNLIEEPSKKEIHIYLPLSYFTSNKSYPVIYFLHRHGCMPGIMPYKKDLLDAQMQNGENSEFIIVEPTGRNRLSGSFYVNSLLFD